MKIEHQVCTKEQGKQLEKLGINPFNSYSFHVGFMSENGAEELIVTSDQYNAHENLNVLAAAFSVAELGIMLPPFFPSFVHDNGKSTHCKNERVDTFPLVDSGGEYENIPAHVHNKELIPLQSGRWEAESRAAMLIFLLENNYTSADEANKRLQAIDTL